MPYLPQPASCGGHPPVASSGSTALQSTRASPLTRAAQRDQEAQKRAWLQPALRSDQQARICFVQKRLTHSSVLLEGKPTGVPGKPSQRGGKVSKKVWDTLPPLTPKEPQPESPTSEGESAEVDVDFTEQDEQMLSPFEQRRLNNIAENERMLQ